MHQTSIECDRHGGKLDYWEENENKYDLDRGGGGGIEERLNKITNVEGNVFELLQKQQKNQQPPPPQNASNLRQQSL